MIHSFTLYGTSVCLWDSDYEQSHQPAQAKVGFMTLSIFLANRSQDRQSKLLTDGMLYQLGGRKESGLRAERKVAPKRGGNKSVKNSLLNIIKCIHLIAHI